MNKNLQLAIDFFKKYKIQSAIILASLVLLLILINFFAHFGTNRRVFYYPLSGSTKNQKEVRYLSSNPVQGKIQLYVDELILGPSFYRGRALFTPGTKVEYCFLREKKLTVGLSKEAVLQEGGAPYIEEGVKLFKKNIKKNFTAVKDIELFIDGNYIAY
ncbi:MAG: hypothetical protein K5873_08200 [Treponema sp.]|nr:hypothetical protein [Treponema sp.]